MPELLFSYGTLQDESVQLATFGRNLTGNRDSLVGYKLSMIAINDAKVAAISGATHHRIVRSTGRNTDTVCGTAFEISADELKQADAYEVDAYTRVRVALTSGRCAWAYVEIASTSASS